MYRRIEFINFFKGKPDHPVEECRKDEWIKSGIMGHGGWDEDQDLFDKMMDCWASGLRGLGTGKNNRYYFTEKGWDQIGRKVVEYAQKLKLEYRIIKIKEKSVDVMAGDKLEVAVRPRKKKPT